MHGWESQPEDCGLLTKDLSRPLDFASRGGGSLSLFRVYHLHILGIFFMTDFLLPCLKADP